MTRIVSVLLVLTTLGFANQLRLHATLERDTVLPYEPVYVRVTVANMTDEPTAMPFKPGTYGDYCYGYAIYSASGRRVAENPHFSLGLSAGWRASTLCAGDSASTLMDVIQERMIAPGGYRVVVGWNADNVQADFPSIYDSSNSAFFVIREPRGEEVAALKAYQEYRFYASGEYFHHPHETELRPGEERTQDRRRRLEPLGRRLIAEHNVEPYAVLTEISLIEEAYQQWLSERRRTAQGSAGVQAWKDSIRTLYEDILIERASSPVAAFFLRCNDYRSYLAETDGEEANVEFLRRLTALCSGSVVAREASRQLAERDGSGR